MFNALIFRVLDISVQPDFNGLPENLKTGLAHLTNNAAAVLLLIAGLGIVFSLCGLVLGTQWHRQEITDRAKSGLLVSASAGALLYVAVQVANYSMGLFR